ncbi:MAG: DEAD/DEAH box helicase [Bacteroidota bacterium]|nr:DEAD/DEAH box helicase [Bacteroidota bacterium]
MIALHISILEGRPYLWGERAESGADYRFVRNRRVKRLPCPRHPGDAGREGLAEAVRRLGLSLSFADYRGPRIYAWLPAVGARPYPSSPALKERRLPDGGLPRLRPFAVTALPFAPDDILLLEACAHSDARIGSGVVLGASVLACAHVVRMGLHLTAAERFLPYLVQKNGRWEARWVPFPDDAVERALADVERRLPASARCLSLDTGKPPSISPHDLLSGFLETTVDHFVRRSGSSPQHAVGARTGRSPFPESIHDAWIDALNGEDAAIRWHNEADIRDFQGQLKRWARELHLLARSPFSFCFRLVEPTSEGGGETWKVEYLLEPKAEPELLLPAAGLWNPSSRAARKTRLYGEESVEFMLTALGQAAGLCPPVAASLRRSNPEGFELDTAGAWQFLREYAPVLEASGFRIILPEWWSGRTAAHRLRASLRASSSAPSGSGFLSLDAITSCDITVSLGDEPLTVDQLRALARRKAPLVRVGGRWTHIEPEEITAALRLLERRSGAPLSGRELIALALGAEKRIGGLEVSEVQLEGWIGDLVDSLAHREELAELPQPENMQGVLRPYQVRGFSWLAFLRKWRLGACLADDMGLGKTIQALALIQHERNAGETKPVLVVCPMSVINNWRNEAAAFTPGLPVMVHHGIDRPRDEAFRVAASKHAMVVTSYGLLQRDIGTISSVDWAGVIFDEAQNIKNPDSKQAQAARLVRAEYRIVMTGTPIENHVGDLWALMDLVNPGLLGSRADFTTDFHKPIHVYGDETRAAALRTVTGPFILRRLKTDRSVLTDLPEKIEIKESCLLTREQAALYQAVVDGLRERVETAEGMERRGLILASLMRLKQVCNHPAQLLKDESVLEGRSGKLARLREVLLEIRQTGERTLVYTQFAEMGKLLRRYIRDLFGEEVFFLYGGTPRADRDEMVERFQNDGDAPRVFVLSLKAGGTGLNLTGANHVIHYDRWWNPAVENQATDRAYRIGQGRNVVVRSFVAAGTLEERIDALLARKSDLAQKIVASGDAWLTELSNTELFDLVRLGPDAVEDDDG